jgi:hypothetical protein
MDIVLMNVLNFWSGKNIGCKANPQKQFRLIADAAIAVRHSGFSVTIFPLTCCKIFA